MCQRIHKSVFINHLLLNVFFYCIFYCSLRGEREKNNQRDIRRNEKKQGELDEETARAAQQESEAGIVTILIDKTVPQLTQDARTSLCLFRINCVATINSIEHQMICVNVRKYDFIPNNDSVFRLLYMGYPVSIISQ